MIPIETAQSSITTKSDFLNLTGIKIKSGIKAKGIKKYFDLNKTAITLVHPAKENQEISFKGGKREPLNTEKISEHKLENEFDIGLYKTKNNNIEYNIALYLDKPYNKKAGVIEVLNEIYSMGTSSMSEDEFKRFEEKNKAKFEAIPEKVVCEIGCVVGSHVGAKCYGVTFFEK